MNYLEGFLLFIAIIRALLYYIIAGLLKESKLGNGFFEISSTLILHISIVIVFYLNLLTFTMGILELKKRIYKLVQASNKLYFNYEFIYF